MAGEIPEEKLTRLFATQSFLFFLALRNGKTDSARDIMMVVAHHGKRCEVLLGSMFYIGKLRSYEKDEVIASGLVPFLISRIAAPIQGTCSKYSPVSALTRILVDCPTLRKHAVDHGLLRALADISESPDINIGPVAELAAFVLREGFRSSEIENARKLTISLLGYINGDDEKVKENTFRVVRSLSNLSGVVNELITEEEILTVFLTHASNTNSTIARLAIQTLLNLSHSSEESKNLIFSRGLDEISLALVHDDRRVRYGAHRLINSFPVRQPSDVEKLFKSDLSWHAVLHMTDSDQGLRFESVSTVFYIVLKGSSAQLAKIMDLGLVPTLLELISSDHHSITHLSLITLHTLLMVRTDIKRTALAEIDKCDGYRVLLDLLKRSERTKNVRLAQAIYEFLDAKTSSGNFDATKKNFEAFLDTPVLTET